MKKKKISLERSRPERSKKRRVVEGEFKRISVSFATAELKKLTAEAKARQLSISLYLNLILHGQEKSPLQK